MVLAHLGDLRGAKRRVRAPKQATCPKTRTPPSARTQGEDSTSAVGRIVDPTAEITTDGEDTVIFTPNGGNADFPFILSDYHLIIGNADGDSMDWRSGDGCGSYVLKNFRRGVSSEFERNPNHWRDDVAWVDSFEMLSIIDQNARTTALVSGDVHASDRVDLKAADLLARRPGVTVEPIAGTQYYTFAMDTRNELDSDNNVRQALKYAIDCEDLVDKILFGYCTVGNDHPIGRGHRFYNDEMEQKAFDPDKARWYLKEAGLDSLDVTLSAADAAFTGAVDAATPFQSSAKQTGINLRVSRESNDGYWSDVWMNKPFSAVYWGGVCIPMFANYVHAIRDDVAHGEMGSNRKMYGERWM